MIQNDQERNIVERQLQELEKTVRKSTEGSALS